MMTRKQNFVFVYVLMNTIMCVCMSAAGLLVNAGFITLPMYAVTLAESLVICNVCSVVFRIPRMGDRITAVIARGGPETKAFGIWAAVVNGTLNSFFMNTFMTLINVGFRAEYFGAWAHSFPIMELVSVVVSILASPVAMKIAGKVK